MIWCKNCGKYILKEQEHNCTAWVVWNPDHGESLGDSRQVFADDEQQAVEIWAERDDVESAEYHIVGGRETVMVCQVINGEPDEENAHKYVVEGEIIAEYHAKRIE